MQDYFGREINVDDYVVYPYNSGSHKIDLNVGKVIKINETTISIITKGWQEIIKTSLKRPERSVIIPKELAIEKEPMFKDLE